MRPLQHPVGDGAVQQMFGRRGQQHIAEEDRLTADHILRCCGHDAMRLSDAGPCVMGVDVGKQPRVIIAQKLSSEGLKVVHLARVADFNEIWDLATRFNVKSAVFDLYPEIHKVREFCNAAPYSAFGCQYSETQRGVAAWQESSLTITVNRTELCDSSHKMITTPGHFELPRTCDEVMVFVREAQAMAKVLEKNAKTGAAVYRYVRTGDDHYRHALNYAILAASRAPVAHKSTPAVTNVNFYYG
jgi:hypothetical protein